VNNSFIGTFPPKGIILYSYFAKLQLNSFAIRGVTLSHTRDITSSTHQPLNRSTISPFHNPSSARETPFCPTATGSTTPTPHRLSTERKEFANTAISSAASILTFVLEEDDMRRALVGTPLYVHTMIAFASVFLMKVTTNWNTIIGLNVETKYVTGLLERMIQLLKGSVTSDRHLLYHIAAGLEKMLERSRQARAQGPNAVAGAVAKLASAQVDGNGSGNTTSSWPSTDVVRQRGSSDVSATFSNQPFHPLSDAHSQGAGTDAPNLDLNGFQVPWPNSYNVASGLNENGTPGTEYGGFLGNNMMIMNDSLIYEAFGSESANDVYNLLTSQFSY
jgi:hypothetical protein